MRNFNGMFLVNFFFKTAMALGKKHHFLTTVNLNIIGMGKSVPQGAVTTINCAVNSALNSQQAIYYSDGVPKQPTNTARYLATLYTDSTKYCIALHIP